MSSAVVALQEYNVSRLQQLEKEKGKKLTKSGAVLVQRKRWYENCHRNT